MAIKRNDWRVLLCDRRGVPLSDISSIITSRRYVETRNSPTSFSFQVDPKDPKVVRRHADGGPYLDYIRRVIKAYRRERQGDGSWRWIIRFVGYVWPVQDNGEDLDSITSVTAFDAMQILAHRFARSADGSFVVVNFNDTATNILRTIVDRTNQHAGATGVVTQGGRADPTPVGEVRWNYKLISEALTELNAVMDAWVTPRDTTVGEHGTLHCATQRGQLRRDVALGWGVAPRNMESITRNLDPKDAANVLVGVGGGSDDSGQLMAVGVDAASIDAYMQLEGIETFSDVTDQTYLNNLTADALYRRRPPQQSVTLGRPVKTTLRPWIDFETGDTLLVNASGQLRGGMLELPMRLEGFSIDITDNGDEEISLATAGDAA